MLGVFPANQSETVVVVSGINYRHQAFQTKEWDQGAYTGLRQPPTTLSLNPACQHNLDR